MYAACVYSRIRVYEYAVRNRSLSIQVLAALVQFEVQCWYVMHVSYRPVQVGKFVYPFNVYTSLRSRLRKEAYLLWICTHCDKSGELFSKHLVSTLFSTGELAKMIAQHVNAFSLYLFLTV